MEVIDLAESSSLVKQIQNIVNNFVKIDIVTELLSEEHSDCTDSYTNKSLEYSLLREQTTHMTNEKVLARVGGESNTILRASFHKQLGKRMTTKFRLAEDQNKSFYGDRIYTYCQQCEWNGIPNQKIVVVYLGLRPANESGFIHKFDTYDYSSDGITRVHRHKYDSGLIDHIVEQIFNRTEGMVD
jgi:hypothetical protein